MTASGQKPMAIDTLLDAVPRGKRTELRVQGACMRPLDLRPVTASTQVTVDLTEAKVSAKLVVSGGEWLTHLPPIESNGELVVVLDPKAEVTLTPTVAAGGRLNIVMSPGSGVKIDGPRMMTGSILGFEGDATGGYITIRGGTVGVMRFAPSCRRKVNLTLEGVNWAETANLGFGPWDSTAAEAGDIAGWESCNICIRPRSDESGAVGYQSSPLPLQKARFENCTVVIAGTLQGDSEMPSFRGRSRVEITVTGTQFGSDGSVRLLGGEVVASEVTIRSAPRLDGALNFAWVGAKLDQATIRLAGGSEWLGATLSNLHTDQSNLEILEGEGKLSVDVVPVVGEIVVHAGKHETTAKPGRPVTGAGPANNLAVLAGDGQVLELGQQDSSTP